MLVLWIAAIVSVATCLLHLFAGGKEAAAPLLANETLPPASKWLNYYCWHITTVLLGFNGAAFAWTAWSGPDTALVIYLTALCAALSILSAAIAIRGSIHPLRFPSTYLFATMAVLGAIALI